MSVHDAKPGDIYVDASGKLWRVVGVFGEPSVIVQEVEPAVVESPVTQTGGVSGLMWHGFKRIYSPPAKRDQLKTPFSLDIAKQIEDGVPTPSWMK